MCNQLFTERYTQDCCCAFILPPPPHTFSCVVLSVVTHFLTHPIISHFHLTISRIITQIQLEPVTLRLSPPDAMQFHADLTELIEKGIRAQQTRHVRTGERTDFVMEARRGSCRLTQYYVQVGGCLWGLWVGVLAVYTLSMRLSVWLYWCVWGGAPWCGS